MNWRFTRKNTPVAFERDEPICMIFPVPRGLIEKVEPEFRSLASDPDVEKAYQSWAESRLHFNKELRVQGSQAQKEKWQKDYFSGRGLTEAPADHRTKVKAKPFK